MTYPFSEGLIENKMYILAIITGGLLYTALADIFPEQKGKGNTKNKLFHLFLIITGVLLFLGFETISEHNHEHEYENHIEENHKHHEEDNH